MRLKNFIAYWLPVILYAGLIFYLSSLSQPLEGLGIPEFNLRDKVFHVVEFFLFSFLILRLLNFYKVKKKFFYAILFATLYGITDEMHQLFVPGRFFVIWDIIANFIGSLFVLFFRKKHL